MRESWPDITAKVPRGRAGGTCCRDSTGVRIPRLETRQGPDGGVDVVAGQGDMGFGHPRLCVQVKSGQALPYRTADYNRLQGNVGGYRRRPRSISKLGDFTRSEVRNENERSFFQIRLWGPNELVDRLLGNLRPNCRTTFAVRFHCETAESLLKLRKNTSGEDYGKLRVDTFSTIGDVLDRQAVAICRARRTGELRDRREVHLRRVPRRG